MPREEHIAASKIHERARQFRGVFLNHIAVIERDIALLLTEHFCREDPTKQQMFFDEIACKFTLERKRTLLIEIVKSDYPSYWRENGQPLKDLQLLQSFRNKLAHSVVDVSPEALRRPIEQGVGFVQWKTGAPITEQEMEDWRVRANTVSSTLASIKALLPYKESTIA